MNAKSDGYLSLSYIALIWAGIVLGFGGAIARHNQPYPLFIHVHAALFSVWLAGFTAQILLIRADNVALHRRLGIAMAFGVGVLAVAGVMTAWLVQMNNAGTPRSDPAFFSVQVGDAIGFVGLAAAGIWLRKDRVAHKRLMLLAILHMSTAGFARWLGGDIGAMVHFGHWGSSFWQTFFILHFTNDVMVLGLGAYDIATRGRLHRAYVLGAAWSFSVQAIQVGLFVSPAWAPVVRSLLGI